MRRLNHSRVIATSGAGIEITEGLLLGELRTTLGRERRPVFGDANDAGRPWDVLSTQPRGATSIPPLGHHEGRIYLAWYAGRLQGCPDLAFVAILVALFALGAKALGELSLFRQLPLCQCRVRRS